MNRREAVVGMIVLPFWMAACRTTGKATPGTLAAIVDAIIPAGAAGSGGPVASGVAPGALAVGVDRYLQKLIDDCYEQADREKFWVQVQAVEDKCRAEFHMSFASAALKERQAVLQQFAQSPKKEERDFFAMIKRETIKGFTTSQRVMMDYLHYKIAPGHYYGCVPATI